MYTRHTFPPKGFLLSVYDKSTAFKHTLGSSALFIRFCGYLPDTLLAKSPAAHGFYCFRHISFMLKLISQPITDFNLTVFIRPPFKISGPHNNPVTFAY